MVGVHRHPQAEPPDPRAAGRNLGLDVEGKTKEVIAQTIKDHLDQPDGIDEIEAEYAPPAIEKPDFSEEGAGKPQWVLNCAKCGEVALKFQPGFDPKNPVVRGAVKPVHLWPFKFVGWPHQDDDALQHRSRENLKCPRCESRLPLAGSGKQVRSQYLRRIS